MTSDPDRAYYEYLDLLDRETVEGREPPPPHDPAWELDCLDADRYEHLDEEYERETE